VISLSAKGFAEFVLAGPSKEAQIVRNILKPKSKEAQVIVLYYSRAIRVIRLYHAKNNDRDNPHWLSRSRNIAITLIDSLQTSLNSAHHHRSASSSMKSASQQHQLSISPAPALSNSAQGSSPITMMCHWKCSISYPVKRLTG
jgi:hypothetical protein